MLLLDCWTRRFVMSGKCSLVIGWKVRDKCLEHVIDGLTYNCDGEVKLRRMGEISLVSLLGDVLYN